MTCTRLSSPLAALFFVCGALSCSSSNETSGSGTSTSAGVGGAGQGGMATAGAAPNGAGGVGATGGNGAGGVAAGGGAPASACGPLDPPTGNIIDVTPADAGSLGSIVNAAAEGSTILFADGTYELNGEFIWISTAGIGLRSASGNRAAVILDGGYQTTEIVTIAASDVTVADITIQRAYTHPIHVVGGSSGHIANTVIYNVAVIDPAQQGIKINQSGANYPDDGLIACSSIILTDTGRGEVRDNCYTGGIDMHKTRGWLIRDNHIEGFWCNQGLSEHGIHAWRQNADTVIERNTIVNCARGIGLGLVTTSSGDDRIYDDISCPASGYLDDYNGLVRNNMVFANRSELFNSGSGFDSGIGLLNACNSQAYHNTVFSTQAPFSSIEWRFEGTNAIIKNNLVSHNLRPRDAATAIEEANLSDAPGTLLVDAAGGDLHLADGRSGAIDQGVPLDVGLADDDFDGDSRDATPDLGADEL